MCRSKDIEMTISSFRLAIFMQFFCFSLFFAPAMASSQTDTGLFFFDSDIRYLDLIVDRKVKVTVDDQISDGCWKNPSTAKNAVQVELLRSGFQLLADSDFGSSIVLSGLGYKTDSGLCVASISLNVRVIDYGFQIKDEFRISSLFSRDLISYKTILSGPPRSSDSRIRDTFVENIHEFIVDLNSVKSEFRKSLKESGKADEAAYWMTLLD